MEFAPLLSNPSYYCLEYITLPWEICQGYSQRLGGIFAVGFEKILFDRGSQLLTGLRCIVLVDFK